MATKTRHFKGLPAAPGIAIGKAHLFESEELSFPKYWVPEISLSRELKRFKNALKKTQEDLIRVKDKLCRYNAEEQTKIVESHQLIARDEVLIQGTIDRIKKQKINAEWAFDMTVQEIFNNFPKTFEVEEDYFKDRYEEIKHVTSRILKNLLGAEGTQHIQFKKNSIVVAHDLSPIDTMQMVRGNVHGFITELGGTTSHTAIVAKALEIPAVVGLDNINQNIKDGDSIIIDGEQGEVIVHPTPFQIKKYTKLQRNISSEEIELLKIAKLPSITQDDFKIRLVANMEIPEELLAIHKYHAEGIGLFRTEMFFLSQNEMLPEEEQFQIYKKMAHKISPYGVTIRTLDIGGDKISDDFDNLDSVNPALGLRGIRYSLKEKTFLKEQLRAILRASHFGNIKILIPMITSLEEIRHIKKIITELKETLFFKKIPFDSHIKLGAMIETPSAALMAEEIASEVDFMSIGTNDLTQYTLAVDRGNDDVSYLYNPLHPSVLKLLKLITDAGKSQNIEVSLCGEMAGNPLYLIILLGLGLSELSMGAASILKVKKLLRSLHFRKCQSVLSKALLLKTTEEIENLLKREIQKYSEIV